MPVAVRHTQMVLGTSADGKLIAVPGASVLIRKDGATATVYSSRAKAALANPLPNGVAAGAPGIDMNGNMTVWLDPDDGYDAVATVGDASTTIPFPTISPDMEDVAAPIPSGTYVGLSTAETITGAKKFTGGKPWWDAETLAELQAGITAAAAAGGGDVRVAVSIALGTTSITVPNTVDLNCVGKGELTYSGNGAAVIFDSQRRAHSAVNVRRLTPTWDTGTDTSSIGVRLKNCSDGMYRILRSEYFETGLELRGEAAAVDAGTETNTIYLGRVTNNKRNVRFSGVTTGAGIGYANQNTFLGGRIRHDSGYASYVGTRGVDMSTAGNGNTFVGVNMEGGATEKVVVVAAVDNVFLNCRQEANAANSWHFLAGSSRNYVIGGQGLLGPADAKYLDESTLKQNVIIGGRGLNVASDGNNAAYTARAINSNADASYKGYNIAGQVVARILGGGQFESYLGTDSFPRVKTDVTGGSAGYGGLSFGRGNVAPTNHLGVNASGNAVASNVDLECVTVGTGFILKSADGTRYRVTVANGGALSAVAV